MLKKLGGHFFCLGIPNGEAWWACSPSSTIGDGSKFLTPQDWSTPRGASSSRTTRSVSMDWRRQSTGRSLTGGPMLIPRTLSLRRTACKPCCPWSIPWPPGPSSLSSTSSPSSSWSTWRQLSSGAEETSWTKLSTSWRTWTTPARMRIGTRETSTSRSTESGSAPSAMKSSPPSQSTSFARRRCWCLCGTQVSVLLSFCKFVYKSHMKCMMCV